MKIRRDTLKKIVCAVKGHSKIVDMCFGYVHCARCGALLGDTLAGCYPLDEKVIVEHGCEVCQENYKKLGFWDKFLAPDPFREQEQEQVQPIEFGSPPAPPIPPGRGVVE